MGLQLSIYLVPLAFAALISFLLAAVVARRSNPLARTFVVLMLAVGTWALATAFEFAATATGTKLLWKRTTYLGSVVAPTAWLLLTARYAGYDERVTRRTVALLSVVPATTLALVWTNGFHRLFWRDVSLTTTSGIAVLDVTFGPWYWINLAYSYLLVVAGIALLVGVLLGSNPLYRRQSAILVVAAAVPFGANVAFNVGLGPIPVDLTTFAFAVAGSILAVSLFHLDLLDLKPFARDALLREMDSPVVVTDVDGAVVDANPAARTVLGPDFEFGDRPLDALDGVESTGDPASLDGEVLSVTVDGRARTYRVRTTALHDHRDALAGILVVMDDVTDLRSREQRLAVLHRVLRHNVRNELTVVLGHLEVAEERHPDDPSLRTAREHAGRVLELSEQAQDVVETVHGDRGDPVTVEVDDLLGRVVERVRESYPAADVDWDAGTARVAVAGEGLLDVAVTNLVENAIEHNDAPEPRVRITTTVADDRVSVAVADDGPGIPETERAVVLEGDETPLRHGSGIGLWLVHWIVTASGGSLRFASNEPRGSVVTITLQRADEP